MKVVLLGATKGMGRALARCMAERGDELFLLGRDAGDLERCARDLEVRGAPAPVRFAPCDLLRPDGFAPALDAAARELGRFDAVVVTAGIYARQEELEADGELRRRLLAVDFDNTIEFCEAARARLLGMGGGVLCVFSSVAGDRARKPVILYGAAKAGLSFYLEGLDCKYRSRGLRTVLVKPGFVRTGMTAGLPEPPIVSEPEAAARTVLKAIDRGRPVVYAPPVWRAVMLAVRSLPRWLMRRVEF
jgi:NAD(P)-dependent dehydrogenase (short-subunit alcohol dehydrogenase family)